MRTSSRAADLDIVEGTLPLGLPYRALGSGPPLVFLRWFTPDHANPAGLMARAEIAALAPLAAHRRVYAVNRAPDMPSGTTMAEIADDHAAALRTEFSAPVDVLGISSGGSVALQLAADHPDVVRRLVVAASASRLEERARVAQLRYAEAAAAGKRALHHMEPEPRTVRARINAAVMWLLDPLARPRNPADALAFVRAEDAFDVTDRLAAITAPTLVIGGERDEFYSPEAFRRTADGIPDSRLVIVPGAGHMGAVRHPRFAAEVLAFLDH
ncbi:alpha/beta fold hydrolase [Nocardia farcinica]|uniref:alpha/beta fold hydrolase n=1 Tax=Nocardia farcinica TaxID=37329 RepID=UPI0018954FF7|nr:alpha/beta fold hydrolase [Nocardia farcinica]MBF6072022.1 alpha/beta fold hydrolase [Nocardia farcinica]